MKTQVKSNLKIIITLIVIVLLSFLFACYEVQLPLRAGIWDQTRWDNCVWHD